MKKKRFYGNDDIQEMLYKLEKNEKLNEDKIEIDNPKEKNQKNEQKSLMHSKMSIPLSEVHAICYRSPHNPLKKSIFFKS